MNQGSNDYHWETLGSSLGPPNMNPSFEQSPVHLKKTDGFTPGCSYQTAQTAINWVYLMRQR